MKHDEALIYLPVDEENDVQDLYDDKLFDLKQFFLNRFPMSKLINARLSKFEKIEAAYQTLGGTVSDFESSFNDVFPDLNSIHEVYAWYNLQKNALRLQLTNAGSLREVKNVLNQYLQVTHFYASFWEVPIKENDHSQIKLGVEPNPMDLQDALSELLDLENFNSDYILALPDENCLKSEAKRLSLWLNFENDEQSV